MFFKILNTAAAAVAGALVSVLLDEKFFKTAKIPKNDVTTNTVSLCLRLARQYRFHHLEAALSKVTHR